MSYNGTVELAAGIKPKNNGSFPLVNAPDVRITDSKRLDAKLTEMDAAISSAATAAADGAEAQAMIAAEEASNTAAAAHAVGDYFRLSGTLYIATAAIAVGDTITVGTNCRAAVLCNDVSDLKSAMQSNADFLYVTSNIVTQIGLTIEKIDDTTFQIYGIATATGYFTLFNGAEQIQASTSTPTKIVPAGEYTVEINIPVGSYNPAPKIRYALGDVWSGALPLESGIVGFPSNAAIAFLANNNADFGTSENPTTVEVRIRKTVTSAVPWILKPSNGDDTPAAWLNLYRYGKCELQEGVYHIAKLRMPDNSILSGCGTKSSIIVNDVVGILPSNSCVVRDVALDGGGTDDVIPTEEGYKNGIVIAVENVQRVRIENCYIHGFASSAIVARDIGGGIRTDIVISRCNLWYNYRGIYLRRQAEYFMISDCSICCNYFGVLNRGGNNKFSNCDIDSNIINVQIDQDEGSNGGHGSMVGCSFNHSNNRENDGYALIIKDTGREIISGCNIHYGKTRLENTSGNVFSGCVFGNATGIEIDGGACSIFDGCGFKSMQETPISRINNDKVEFIDCYTRSGDAVEITAYPKASAAEVNDLKSALKSGDEEDAIYHLGFYLDENGDLCQVESN